MLSKSVPRPAGRTTGAFVCVCAIADSDDARTVAIHDARASSAPKTSKMQRSNNRMREFTTRERPEARAAEPRAPSRETGPPLAATPPLLPREVEVARVARRGRDIAEPVGRLLDPLRGGCARDLGRECRILRLEFELLVVEPAHAHVHAEDGDVQRNDAGEHDREHRDPGDASTEAPLRPGTRHRAGA